MRLKLTKKRRAYVASYFSIAVGAIVALQVDKGTGIGLMMAGIYTIGRLQREVFPHGDPSDYTDGHKTPKPTTAYPPPPPKDMD